MATNFIIINGLKSCIEDKYLTRAIPNQYPRKMMLRVYTLANRRNGVGCFWLATK